MIVTREDTGYKPVTVSITLQLKQERDDLYNLLNHQAIIESMETDFSALREELGKDILTPDKGVTTNFSQFSKNLREQAINKL